MKIQLRWLVIFLASVVILGGYSTNAKAFFPGEDEGLSHPAPSYLPEITPIPTDLAPVVVTSTSDRQLPPVGSNSGLVIGASVLVLIIIGGVLGSRRRVKH